MSRNRSKESLKPRIRSSHNRTVKQASRKANVHGVKAQSSRGRTARAVDQPVAKQVKISTQAKVGNNKTSRARNPITANPQVQELERGGRLKQLHEKGFSLAELARKFGHSKSLVRDLVQLASLPPDLEAAYLRGELGRKKVLQMARKKREKRIETKPALTTGERERRLDENPAPVAMTAEQRQKRIADNVQLIVDWFHSLDLASCYWEGFFQQVKYGLYGPFRWIFRQEAPKPDEINPDEDPKKVIESCKVEGGNPSFVPDIINNAVTWLARWAQRVIPDRALMEDAVDMARGQLLCEARKERWG